MAWSLVASSMHPAEVATTPLSNTLGASCAVGDRVVVALEVGDATTTLETISSVSATFCDTFTKDVETAEYFNGAYTKVSLWSAPVTSTGTPVVTIVFVGSWGCASIGMAFRGLNTSVGLGAVDQSASNTGSGTAVSATTANTTAANELAVSVYGDATGGQSAATLSKGTGYTYDTTNGHTTFASTHLCTAEYKDSGSSGSAVVGDWTIASDTWGTAVAVYKLDGGGAVVSSGTPPMMGQIWL